MLYLLIKAFHLAAVLTWIGGLLALSLMLGALAQNTAGNNRGSQPLQTALYRWDRRVTTPALALVWVLGITLAVMSGWYSAPWLWAKLLIVFILSGVHGHQSATLRRLLANPARPSPAYMRPSAGFTLAALTAVALLVILKP